jgi:hypothetical protein
MPTSAALYIGQIMEWCAEKGVALVVRLLPADPSKDIGLAIMSHFHYPPDVPIATCATIEEAMSRLLDEKNELHNRASPDPAAAGSALRAHFSPVYEKCGPGIAAKQIEEPWELW